MKNSLRVLAFAAICAGIVSAQEDICAKSNTFSEGPVAQPAIPIKLVSRTAGGNVTWKFASNAQFVMLKVAGMDDCPVAERKTARIELFMGALPDNAVEPPEGATGLNTGKVEYKVPNPNEKKEDTVVVSGCDNFFGMGVTIVACCKQAGCAPRFTRVLADEVYSITRIGAANPFSLALTDDSKPLLDGGITKFTGFLQLSDHEAADLDAPGFCDLAAGQVVAGKFGVKTGDVVERTSTFVEFVYCLDILVAAVRWKQTLKLTVGETPGETRGLAFIVEGTVECPVTEATQKLLSDSLENFKQGKRTAADGKYEAPKKK